MKYIPVAEISDISPGEMTSVSAEGKQLLLANVDGGFFAILQKCPHLGANLCKGTLAGPIVTCPMHGAAFDVTTGMAVQKAKILFLKMGTKGATTFPVKIDGNQVLVGV